MSKVKKSTSILLAVLMLVSVFTVVSITASAKTSGNFVYEVLSDGTVKITEYTGSADTVTIPEKIDGRTVTVIGNYYYDSDSEYPTGAFEDSSIQIIYIPASITKIDDWAFFGCYDLQEVHYAGSISDWNKITIYDGNDCLDEAYFYYNSGSSTQPETTEPPTEDPSSVSDNFMYKILSDGTIAITKYIGTATTVTIPTKIDGRIVTVIGNYYYDSDSEYPTGAFEGSNIQSITIPIGITKIDDWAFWECYYLEEVHYAGSITDWNKIAIYDGNECLDEAYFYYNSGDPIQPEDYMTEITVSAAKKTIGVNTITKVTATVFYAVGNTTFTSSDTKIATVLGTGKTVSVRGKKVGTVTITAKNNGKSASVKINVVKNANPMKVKGKTVKAKAKKATTISKAKAFSIKSAKGTVSFTKASGDKKITISKTGKITVKKGLTAGKTYNLKVKIKAAGNAAYKLVTKTATVKIKIV